MLGEEDFKSAGLLLQPAGKAVIPNPFLPAQLTILFAVYSVRWPAEEGGLEAKGVSRVAAEAAWGWTGQGEMVRGGMVRGVWGHKNATSAVAVLEVLAHFQSIIRSE